MKRINLLITAALCIVVSSALLGQSSGDLATKQATPPGRIPLTMLYRHFLAYQNHLDRAAAALDKQGKNGAGLRDHFQEKLGFTDAEFSAVRQTALRLEAELNAQDAKAKVVIDATRAKFPRVIANPEDLPPVPPELIQLQKERDSIIEKEMTGLQTALGPGAAAKLDTFLERNFAPTVTVQSVAPPGPHDPSQHPVPAFSQEAQQ